MQPTQPIDGILTALAEQVAELDGLVRDLDEAGLALPSRCPGWSISDVLVHLAQTNEMTVASAEGRFTEEAAAFGNRAGSVPPGSDIDDLAGLAVAADRGAPGKEVYDRWRASSAAQAAALGACEAGTRLPWVAGDLAAITLATTRLAETWIHTGDVAAGLGRDMTVATDRLRPIARLAWRTLPYAFARAGKTMAGPVALRLTGPDGTIWEFDPNEPAATTVSGPALDFCLLAARRVAPSQTALVATGPDGAAVLELVRTFA
ncbi:MAG TPA: maleylpyruvate isomerase family mycothiol-dependent enzyme [Acidimicrobiia bacterium]|nr:maleylpyruvate isomerase family mycothiol-dependent enzyme [Acidimicrobiia bacterium]